MNIISLLPLARRVAVSRQDERHFRLAAIGIRADGAIVVSRNGTCTDHEPKMHAEARLCRKLSAGSTVVVIRVRADGSLGIAKPCPYCESRLRIKRATTVYYSTREGNIERLW